MTESALEPRLHTVGVVDGKLPPGIYSARDSEAMYTFTDSAKVKQGAYRIENEGMTLEGSGLDPKVQEFRWVSHVRFKRDALECLTKRCLYSGGRSCGRQKSNCDHF
eukprot:188145-Rhodomonas_salina.1